MTEKNMPPKKTNLDHKSQLDEPMVMVGAIIGAHGVAGMMKVKSFTADPDAIKKYGPFYDEKGRLILTPTGWHSLPKGPGFMAKEIPNREDAALAAKTALYIPRSKLPKIKEEDDYYIVDLIGLLVKGLDGEDLGKVVDVSGGVQDVLKISGTPNAKGSWLLPFTRELVPEVDLDNGFLTANPANGLIDWLDDKNNQNDDLEEELGPENDN